MSPIRCLLVYLTVVFVGGALLAPWLYWLVDSIPALSHLADKPFHRFVNRSLLGLAVLGLYPLLRGIGIRSWNEIGLIRPPRGMSLLAGLALGFISLAVVAAVALGCGARELNSDSTLAQTTARFGKAALTAVVVATLEELLFRGALFGALRKHHHWIGALILSSAVYALVHFFQRPPQPESITWLTGFATLGTMLIGFVTVQDLIPGFLTLLVAGMMLALMYQRTGNLYFSIGLHAGWIFWLKSYGRFTRADPDANSWFWGTHKLTDGWLALFVLTPILVLLWLRHSPAHRRSVTPEP